jgi:thiamine-monophosphate kinase
MSFDPKRIPTRINQVGEFGLIDLIKKQIFSKGEQVVVNMGDDAAVVRSSPQRFLIFTTDTMVERVHFDLSYFTYEEIGWKAMVANLSDIAAMGGLPKFALVTIGLPKSMRTEDVLSIYRGASKIAKAYNCKIMGGDTTLVPRDLFVSIALLGEVEKGFLVTRSGAKKGDLICVTGKLGEAQAGLEFLKKHGRQKLPLIRKHLKPQPRIREARILVKNLKINSLIDISDGLSSEILHLTNESHLGALVYERNIPISPKCLKFASILKRSALDMALSSGEEYELLFTMTRKDRSKLDKFMSKLNVSVIGEMVDQKEGVKLITSSGKKTDLKKIGFTHF